MGSSKKFLLIGGGVGVLAVVIILIVALSGGHGTDSSTGGSEVNTSSGPSSRPTTSPSFVPTGRPHQNTDQAMAAYFAAAPPATRPADRPMDDYLGNWEAKVVSIDGDNDPGAIRDLANIPPINLSIQKKDGAYTLTATDGHGLPRKLTTTPDGLIARGDADAPDLHLSLRDKTLVGFLEMAKPAKGRMEFYATRK